MLKSETIKHEILSPVSFTKLKTVVNVTKVKSWKLHSPNLKYDTTKCNIQGCSESVI